MEITYFGYSCLELKQKGTTVLMDPYEPTGVIAHPRAKAHVATISRPALPDEQRKTIPGVDTDTALVFDAPGGYEAKGILFEGFGSYADSDSGEQYGPNTIFALQWSGMNIVHLGRLGHELGADQLEELGTVDIVCVTIGDRTDAKLAAKVTDQIEPRLIIAMPIDEGMLDAYIKEVGVAAEYLDMLKCEAKDLPTDAQRLVVLKAQ